MRLLRAAPGWCVALTLSFSSSSAAAAAAASAFSSSDDGAFCVAACRSSFFQVKFTDVPENTPFGVQECTSSLHLQSLYLCAGLHCSSQEVRIGSLTELNETCLETAGVSLPSYDLVKNFTDEDIAGLERLDASDREASISSGAPILPTDDSVDLWARTLVFGT